MRELASREYTPVLAYAASATLVAHLLVAYFIGRAPVSSGVHLLFVPILALLVAGVEAAPWARVSGLAWVGLALLGDVMALGGAIAGADLTAANLLSALALLPGAAWVYGASMQDEGAGHAMGAGAAAALGFSGLLAIVSILGIIGSSLIVSALALLTPVLAIAWFAVLAKDLKAGRRHWGGHRTAF